MATAIAEPPHLTADLKALYLSTVASQWRPLAEQAARQRQAPADCLAQLVHLEVTGRRERRIQRRIQDARFPMLKTLDAFSFEAQPGPRPRRGFAGLRLPLRRRGRQRRVRRRRRHREDPSLHRLGDGLLSARLPGAVRDRGRAGHHARRPTRTFPTASTTTSGSRSSGPRRDDAGRVPARLAPRPGQPPQPGRPRQGVARV